MSANGSINTTLDYQFFDGAVVKTGGTLTGALEPSLVFVAQNPVNAEPFTYTLEFGLVAGIETPTVYGEATNLSIDFTIDQSGFIEFGVQRYLTSNANTMIIPFGATSEGYSIVEGTFDNILPFTSETNIYVFSEGPAAGTFGFTVLGKGTNVATHIYARVGASFVQFQGIDHNGVKMISDSNDVNIVDNGIRQAEII